MSRTALVTGCHGFWGRALVRRLGALPGLRVLGADLAASAAVELADYRQVDLRDARAVEALVDAARPDWIFNLAGVFAGDADRVYGVNLLGALHLLEAVRAHCPAARTILIGSAAEYGLVAEADNPLGEDRACQPATLNGLSKHAMTQAALALARLHGLAVLVLRPFNLIGPGLSEGLVLGAVLARARRALAQPGAARVAVGNLEARRDVVTVDDAVDACLCAAAAELRGEVLNVCSGRAVAIRDLVARLLAHAPRAVQLEVDPALLRPVDVPLAVGDPRKTERLLGWRARGDVDLALRAMWDAA